MKRFWLLVLFGVAAAANAGAPDKLAEVAGNQPSQAQAMQAVITELRHTMKEPRDLERVRFFSGPHLVTGVNFANGREQAWLMCVVVGDSRLSRHAPDLEVRPFLMRNRADGLKLVTQGNWTDSDAKC